MFVDKYLVTPLYAAGSLFILWFGSYLGLLSIYRFIATSGLSVAIAGLALLLALWFMRHLISWIAALYGLAIIGCCVLLMIPLDYFWDGEWDSAAFHLPAILALMDGWNPTEEARDIIWLNTYPNGWWTLSATAATLLGHLGLSAESARIMNYLLPLITLGLALGFADIAINIPSNVIDEEVAGHTDGIEISAKIDLPHVLGWQLSGSAFISSENLHTIMRNCISRPLSAVDILSNLESNLSDND